MLCFDEKKTLLSNKSSNRKASTRKRTKESNEWVLSIFGSGGLVFCYYYVYACIFNLHDNLFIISCPQSKQEIHRRSARLRSTKYKAPASEKKVSTKGKGRRHIFKLKNVRQKLHCSVYLLLLFRTMDICVWHQHLCVFDLFPQPIKAPESVATIITSESVFYKVWNQFLSSSSFITFLFLMVPLRFYSLKLSFFVCFISGAPQLGLAGVFSLCLCLQGVYYQTGDVIKVTDEEDGKPYYAQIRGFMQDQYCEKSAALTWLIPTQSSPKDQFDPGTFIVGK